jgi:hypothetical protein
MLIILFVNMMIILFVNIIDHLANHKLHYMN